MMASQAAQQARRNATASGAVCVRAPLLSSKRMVLAALSILLFAVYLGRDYSSYLAPRCRCFPGDTCWPSGVEWAFFNQSVDGRLIATVPLAKPCHDPDYNAEECAVLRDAWMMPDIHYKSSSSIMTPWFTNGTCDPFSPVSKPCTLGNYVEYAVNVSKPEHIVKTLEFVRSRNIRLVLRNTGHDFSGKSTGAGAVAIWTHHLKDLEIKEVDTPFYSGKAMKLGAGVQASQAYKMANDTGLLIVGGECSDVGLAGGYSTGGGHSHLSSKYGLGADQVLEWEVIDGKGEMHVANRTHNSDLYWALSGGGGGTYGVVWSMTVKARPTMIFAGANVTYTNEGIQEDTFYEALGKFHEFLPSLVDNGATAVYFMTASSFAASPITAPGMTSKELEELLKPYTQALDELGVKYELSLHQSHTYLDYFEAMQQAVPVGVANFGSWLVPRSVVEEKNQDLVDVMREVIEQGAFAGGVALNVTTAVAGDVDNAVLPAWRDALVHWMVATPWSFEAPRIEMKAWQTKMTEEFVPRIKALAPGSGAYMNEADFNQPDFKSAFYGKNYERLKEIKRKYDPHDIFWALTAVGSDDRVQRQDGRLCRV